MVLKAMVDVNGVLEKYHVNLLGEFSIYSPTGELITPKQKKSRACLVLLLTEPNMKRRREWIARMLWPDVSPTKAHASLRQTLSNIRKSLGEKHSFLLDGDKLSVSLHKQYITTDTQNIKPELETIEYMVENYLDGFDYINNGFNDWLTSLKATFHTHLSSSLGKSAPEMVKVPVTDILVSSLVLRINQPRISSDWEPAGILADLMVDLASQLISEFYDVSIVDYRMLPHRKHSTHSDLELNVTIVGNDKNISISMSVMANQSHTLIANEMVTTNTKEIAHLQAPAVSSLVNRAVEKVKRSAKVLLGNSREQYLGFDMINTFFDLDQERLSKIEGHLIANKDSYDPVTYIALLAYLRSFGMGENIALKDDKYTDLIKQNSASLYRNMPFNSISLACLGHHESYVEKNLEQGRNLLKASLDVNQHQAFAWDHYALNRLYAGDYSEALTAAGNAIRLGVFSPLLFSYETTLGMIHVMRGDCNTAIKFCERALARQPRFLAAKRFLTVALIETQQMEKAAQSFIELAYFDPEMNSDMGVKSRIFSVDKKRLDWLVLNMSKARSYAVNHLDWRIE